jgi:hypothetical protein
MSSNRVNHRGGVGCEEVFPGSDYTDEEREFLQAIDRYKRTQRRPYPTWREVLKVLRELGWRKVAPPASTPAAPHGEDAQKK